jgi:hypothetical protein
MSVDPLPHRRPRRPQPLNQYWLRVHLKRCNALPLAQSLLDNIMADWAEW